MGCVINLYEEAWCTRCVKAWFAVLVARRGAAMPFWVKTFIVRLGMVSGTNEGVYLSRNLQSDHWALCNLHAKR
jgi:hypothetical protein